MKRHTVFMNGKTQKLILKKYVLPKVVYSFNINSKSQQDFFINIHKIILKLN